MLAEKPVRVKDLLQAEGGLHRLLRAPAAFSGVVMWSFRWPVARWFAHVTPQFPVWLCLPIHA